MKMAPRQIDLHIDEVVLHGFDGLEGTALRPALERELARLLTEHGLPHSWVADARIVRLNGTALKALPNAAAPEVGRQVACAVYGGLKR